MDTADKVRAQETGLATTIGADYGLPVELARRVKCLAADDPASKCPD